MADRLTRATYVAAVNALGRAGYCLAAADWTMQTGETCLAVFDALELARLALQAAVGEVTRQAERDHGAGIVGDPGANLDQLMHGLREEGLDLYWDIAS
jgi:hypothetical protein